MDNTHWFIYNVVDIKFRIYNKGVNEQSLKGVDNVFMTSSRDIPYKSFGNDTEFWFKVRGSRTFLTISVGRHNFQKNFRLGFKNSKQFVIGKKEHMVTFYGKDQYVTYGRDRQHDRIF